MFSARPDTVDQPVPGDLPPSYAQRRLMAGAAADGPGARNSLTMAWTLSGEVDDKALEAALRDVISRHERLRTVFPGADGAPLRRVLPADGTPFELHLVESPPAHGHDFDLRSQIPVRAWLTATGPDEQVLTLAVHPVAADGWSAAPLIRDLSAACAAPSPGAAPGLGGTVRREHGPDTRPGRLRGRTGPGQAVGAAPHLLARGLGRRAGGTAAAGGPAAPRGGLAPGARRPT